MVTASSRVCGPGLDSLVRKCVASLAGISKDLEREVLDYSNQESTSQHLSSVSFVDNSKKPILYFLVNGNG